MCRCRRCGAAFAAGWGGLGDICQSLTYGVCGWEVDTLGPCACGRRDWSAANGACLAAERERCATRIILIADVIDRVVARSCVEPLIDEARRAVE